MVRKYELKQRAESQERTRQRIVEAAVALHELRGPANTTITDIADQAGVGRLTVYRHFPDEESLLSACSGHYWELHPAPDPTAWKRISGPSERLLTALRETYAYHRRTEPMIGKALRDRGDHNIMDAYHDHWRQAADIVASAWRLRGRKRRALRAAVGHALAFETWKSLVRREGLDDDEAAKLMLRLTCECTDSKAADTSR